MKKLLIVDDHRIFTDGIRFLIEHTTELEVTGVLHLGNEVPEFLSRHVVDIVLLDIDLPDLPGFDVARNVSRSHPNIRILALSMLDDLCSMERMSQAGARGFCVKSDGREEVFKGIQRILDGGTHWPQRFLDFKKNGLEKVTDVTLTSRETEIIPLITSGLTTGEIAEKLFISTRTVETHRKNIYRKLNIHNNMELARYAGKHKIS